MHPRASGPALALLVALAALAGCVSSPPDGAASSTRPVLGADGLYHQRGFSGNNVPVEVAFAPGALGTLANLGTREVQVQVPDHTLLLDGTKFALPPVTLRLAPGHNLTFLASPGTHRLALTLDHAVLAVDPAGLPASTTQIVSGERMVQAEEVQEARFPHRQPGLPNYAASQAYFAQQFRDLGYQVEVDPYGTSALPCIRLCPGAFANIVATKPGSGPHAGKVLFVAGGHYDMVPGTTHAAFDNTGGSVGTLELASALAPYTFDHTLKFALWGGEESGTLGSAFWVHTHPDAIATVVDYWNLDVIGMSWPAHPQEPSPILVAAGPDAPSAANDGGSADPLSLSLLGFAQTLQRDWFGYPDAVNGTPVFRYEGVQSGERAGYAKVNSQSDHESFTNAGIPAWFIFNGDTLKAGNPIRIHDNRDTLANMTKVALDGKDANLAEDLSPQQAE
ncbi:MAG: hypothetical protein QOI63_403, partial [Thermoplasmata archaeon]|nr:hypothetical protein [Thermoplasmata archaeon]